MLTGPMLDPTGSLITELRTDSDVSDLVGARVRGFEPAPGDAKGPGAYQAFVVVVALAVPPHPRVPITFADYLVRCYGATPQGASAVWGAVVKAVHKVGPRVKTNGLGIYQSAIASGGEQLRDPDTKQPYVEGVIQVIATAQAIT
jgi:hypothetical protein